MRNKKNTQLISVVLGLPILFFLYNNCGDPAVDNTNSSSESPSKELGNDAFSGNITSRVDPVDKSGMVLGFAYDPENQDSKLRVYAYIDGGNGVGKPIGEVVANVEGFGDSAGHYFSFKIPDEYHDGRSHNIFFYGHQPDSINLLSGSPKSFVIYPTLAEDEYNKNLKSYVSNNCARCHTWNYKNLFYGPLTNPEPHLGGSKTNNQLIDKLVSGHNGNTCGGNKNNTPCIWIQNWWSAEFE